MCQQKVTVIEPWQYDSLYNMTEVDRQNWTAEQTALATPETTIPERSMVVLCWIAIKEYKIAGYSIQLWTYPANSIVPIKTVLDFHTDHYNAMRCARTWAAQYQIECKGVIDD